MTNRVLFIAPHMPYPPNGGGIYNSFRILSHINAHYPTTVFMLEKTGDEASVRDFHSVMGHDRIHSLYFNRERTPVTFLESILARKPLAVYRNYSHLAQRKISELAASADVLFVDHYLMYQYVPFGFSGRVVVLTHNAEYLLWQRAAAYVGALKSLVLKYEARRVRQYEIEMLRGVDSALALRNDLETFRDLGVGTEKLVERPPFGEEESLVLPEINFAANAPVVLFLGTLSWEANLDGIRWFLTNCWPQIRTTVPGAEFWIGGLGGTDALKVEFSTHPSVRYLGFVADVQPIYSQARLSIAPLRYGSGIKIKVLNTLFRGLPAVCTTCAVEGLGCQQGDGVLVTDEAQEFARFVVSLINDPVRSLAVARQGRQFARENFSGTQLFRAIDFAIEG